MSHLKQLFEPFPDREAGPVSESQIREKRSFFGDFAPEKFGPPSFVRALVSSDGPPKRFLPSAAANGDTNPDYKYTRTRRQATITIQDTMTVYYY